MKHRYWLLIASIAAIVTFATAAGNSAPDQQQDVRVVDVLRARAEAHRAANRAASAALPRSTASRTATAAPDSTTTPTKPAKPAPNATVTVPPTKESKDSRQDAQAKAQGETLQALKLAANQLKTSTYKAIYRLQGHDDRTGDLNGRLTLGAKSNRNYFGLTGTIGQDQGSFIVITNGGDAYLCIEGQGDSACLKTHAPKDAVIPLPAVISLDDILNRAANAPGVLVREVGTQPIAGREGRCLEVVAPDVGMGTICLSKEDNLLLSIDGQFRNSKFVVKLEDFNPAPEDKEFDPPFTVTELP